MSIKALQDYTYYSRYARYNKEAKRRETWGEATDRVKQMHLKKYPQIAQDIEWAFDLVEQKRVLGSQRALQFGGTPIEKKNARIYNCVGSYCDRLRFFQECFHLLLCGCGTGFSVQKHHIAKLPGLLPRPINNLEKYYIPDTIEGWADALGILLATYFPSQEFPEWSGKTVEFDYSFIRPAGSVLASGVGKAPGSEPLKLALNTVRKHLDACIASGREKLRPIDAYDIIMHASDAVLSGGVRRSATLCIFSPDDREMVEAKTGNWFIDNPQRGRSNNSALLLREKTTREEFESLMSSVKQFGEPGFIWGDSLESLFNPCCEINFYAYDEDGNSGWQACVSSDTRLITKDGIISIGESVGKPVEIWNGKKWKKVIPFQTGSNRKLYRVTLSDGSFLDCTDNHKWIVKNRFQKNYSIVQTKDLMNFSLKYKIRTPSPNIQWNGGQKIEKAYEYGFILGDGCCKRTDTIKKVRKPFCTLFAKDHDLNLACRELAPNYNYNVKATNVTFDDIDYDFCYNLKYNRGLPKDIFTWDRKSCINFIAGWMDSDGSKQGRGFRIYGEENKIRDLQLLLTKLGTYSSVNLMEEAGTETNLGIRKHDVWYVQVSDTKDLFSRKFKLKKQPRKQAGKGMHQLVESVEELPGRHETFCVNEPESNQCVFNTVLTQQCNLCEINGGKIKTKEDFADAAKAAAIIGTCQAGYDIFEYLGAVTERIIRKEALLGVSLTGMMDNPAIIFDPEIQKEMAQLIIRTNEELAVKIGINPAARTTCVKPAGSTSCILGTSSGIHPHHARRYLRRVQGNSMEPVLQYFKESNPSAVETSVWSANKTDEVITFCCEVPDGAKTKNDTSAIDLLDHVRLTQQNWVAAGKVDERCTQPWLMHNVSNTINVQENEWDQVADYIYNNRKWFAGISLLPASGDLDYPQAPFCNVLTPREILQKYGDGALLASGLIVDGLHAFNNNLWKACDAVLGFGDPIVMPITPGNVVLSDAIMNSLDNCSQQSELTDVVYYAYKAVEDSVSVEELQEWSNNLVDCLSKKAWIRRVKQFAERYCENDIKKCLHLLKHVNNWKMWLDLKREYKDIDYTNLIEELDVTEVAKEWACSGQGCVLT